MLIFCFKINSMEKWRNIAHNFLGFIILLGYLINLVLTPVSVFFCCTFLPFIKYYSMNPDETSCYLYFLLKFINACPLYVLTLLIVVVLKAW